MNKPLIAALALAFGAAHLAMPSEATGQLSLEGRIGSSMPTGELTNDPGLNQTAGFSFAVDGMASLSDLMTAYAGVSRHAFNCSDCPDAGAGIDWLVSPRLAVVPALRANSYGSGDLSLTYLTVDLGLHLHLGR